MEINLPSDELFEVASDPADLPVVSGMWVSSALKKLYNCNRNTVIVITCQKMKFVKVSAG